MPVQRQRHIVRDPPGSERSEHPVRLYPPTVGHGQLQRAKLKCGPGTLLRQQPSNLDPSTQIPLPKTMAVSPPLALAATQKATTNSPHMTQPIISPQAAPGNQGPSTQIPYPVGVPRVAQAVTQKVVTNLHTWLSQWIVHRQLQAIGVPACIFHFLCTWQ